MVIGGYMPLSCWINDEGPYWYETARIFEEFYQPKRKRCWSCKQLINIKSWCIRFNRFRDTMNDMEERIYGDHKRLADWFLCESCGEIYLNLDAIGYNIWLDDNMNDLLKEYHKLTGFKRSNNESHI